MFELYLENSESCEYLPDEIKQNLFFFTPSLSEEKIGLLISKGFRHFGNYWFKPGCPQCTKCLGIRINTTLFSPSKSQRRLLNRNSDLHFSLCDVQIDDEHLALVNQYHHFQHEQWNWRYQQFTSDSYAESFHNEMPCAKEFQVRTSEGELIGVGIVDITPELQSSVYFYYHPQFRHRGLGNWTILKEIELCQLEKREWLHLGLYNESARSLNYKGRFFPFELLPQLTVEESAEEALQILFDDCY